MRLAGRDEGMSASDKSHRFYVRLMCRQNATWQGEVQWLDGRKSRLFRSLLELLMLMNEALEGSKREDVTNVKMLHDVGVRLDQHDD